MRRRPAQSVEELRPPSRSRFLPWKYFRASLLFVVQKKMKLHTKISTRWSFSINEMEAWCIALLRRILALEVLLEQLPFLLFLLSFWSRIESNLASFQFSFWNSTNNWNIPLPFLPSSISESNPCAPDQTEIAYQSDESRYLSSNGLLFRYFSPLISRHFLWHRKTLKEDDLCQQH